MRYVFTFLLLCGAAFGQYDDLTLLPYLHESYISPVIGTVGVTIPVPESVQVGDWVGVGVVVPGPLVGHYNCTDGLFNTYTYTTTQSTSGPIPASGYLCYVCSTAAGPNTITVADPSPGAGFALHLYHLKNVSCNTDGALQVANFNGANTTLSTTHTPTVNGDIIVGLAFVDMFWAVNILQPAPPTEYASFTSQATNPMDVLGTINRGGAVGVAVNPTVNISYANSATMNVTLMTQAFKPTTNIAVTTTRLPEGDILTPYVFCLNGVGGTAALSFSASGYAPGLSFNTGTGCFSGTPASAGSFSVVTQVSDGTISSSPVNLTMKIGNALQTPSIISTNAFASDLLHSGNFSVTCGDNVTVVLHAFDTHGGEGWIGSCDGVNNNIVETLNGLKFHRLESFPGTANAGIIACSVQAVSTGTESITINTTTT